MGCCEASADKTSVMSGGHLADHGSMQVSKTEGAETAVARTSSGVPSAAERSSADHHAALLAAIAPCRAQLLRHPLYARVRRLEEVWRFQEHHVFAVFDFMSLLKVLQRTLTCVDVPWTPKGDRAARRFINEIVLGEESDEDGLGGFTSHFELYCAAMRECGADVRAVETFLGRLGAGEAVETALTVAPHAARAFVTRTFETVRLGSLPRIAGAFTLGREDVIPEMFRQLVADLERQSRAPLSLFRRYLDRHIAVDGEHHGPMATRLLRSLCADDAISWREAEAGARHAIEARLALWDGIIAVLPAHQGEVDGARAAEDPV
jgi:hypothetical protein